MANAKPRTTRPAAIRASIAKDSELINIFLRETTGPLPILEECAIALKKLVNQFINDLENAIHTETGKRPHYFFKIRRKAHYVVGKDGKSIRKVPVTNNGRTICYCTLEKGGKLYKGESVCTSIDTFDGKFGRNVAKFRALSACLASVQKKRKN